MILLRDRCEILDTLMHCCNRSACNVFLHICIKVVTVCMENPFAFDGNSFIRRKKVFERKSCTPGFAKQSLASAYGF